MRSSNGRLEGKAAILVQLLELKFGALSAGTKTRIASAKEEDLSAWTKLLFSATSCDDVFAADSGPR
jgi:hypothetical protein